MEGEGAEKETKKEDKMTMGKKGETERKRERRGRQWRMERMREKEGKRERGVESGRKGKNTVV